jgi:ubiquitin C-terminal hydrolase
MDPFMVTNAGNTCYIDSLLISLFYFPSNIHNLVLEIDPKNPNSIYLQECIKTTFVNPVKNNKNIQGETMDMIRNICFSLGWKNNNINEYYAQQDIGEFYEFIMNNIGGMLIETQRRTIIENALPDADDIGKIENMSFIPLSIPSDSKVAYLNSMLSSWMHDNPMDIQRNVINNITGKTEQMYVRGLSSYRIVNIPPIIPLWINRYSNTHTRIDTDVIIQESINPYKNSYQENTINISAHGIKWNIHSIICHQGETSKSGHYFTIVYDDIYKKWYMFDDLNIPCMIEISMKDKNIINCIKKNCVFIIYKLL